MSAGRLLSIRLCGVGGQMMVVVVRQLTRRLAPRARRLRVEEVHGMAQRGGSISALIELELNEPGAVEARTVLLGLEWIEGARALGKLGEGDRAFIGAHLIAPPGGGAAPPPTKADLTRRAAELGVSLVVIDEDAASPGMIVQAAIDQGAIP